MTSRLQSLRRRPRVGVFGFGAFGRLIVEHLHPHLALTVCDPALGPDATDQARIGDLAATAGCDIVVLAVPVREVAALCRRIRPHLRPGAIVLDVGSVKMEPLEAMRAELPEHVEIIGTHPLFGPQSAGNGLSGLKIVLCPLRGRSHRRIAGFLRRALGLEIMLATAEAHDRDVATVQGLTHFIARILVQMDPPPNGITTVSYDHLMRATEMVRGDAENVFEAIEKRNVFTPAVLDRFCALAEELRAELPAARSGVAA